MPSRKTREGLLANIAMIIIVLVALLPIATTVLISFKREAGRDAQAARDFPLRHRNIGVRHYCLSLVA